MILELQIHHRYSSALDLTAVGQYTQGRSYESREASNVQSHGWIGTRSRLCYGANEAATTSVFGTF